MPHLRNQKNDRARRRAGIAPPIFVSTFSSSWVYQELHPHHRRPLNMMGGCQVRPGQLGQPRTRLAVSKGENARLFEAYPRPRSGKVPQGGETIHPYAGSRTHRTGPWPTYSKLANGTSNSGLIEFGWSDRNRVMNRYLLLCLLPSIAIG